MKLLLIVLGAFVSVMAQTVKVAADEWFPMNGQPDASQPGYMIDIAVRALALSNMAMTYELLPWERAISEAEIGGVDCVVGAYYDDVPNFVFGEQPYGYDQSALYTLASDDWQFTGVPSIASRVVAAISGYTYDESIDSWLSEHADTVAGEGALERNLQKLRAGRVDAVIESIYVMGAKLEELSLSGEVKMAGKVGEPDPLFIACAPDNPRAVEIVAALDRGVLALRESGELATIMASYGLRDWY